MAVVHGAACCFQTDQDAKVATLAVNSGGAAQPIDDDLEPAAAPPPRASSDRRPRRGAVSAEVYNEEDAANYVKTVSKCDEIIYKAKGFISLHFLKRSSRRNS